MPSSVSFYSRSFTRERIYGFQKHHLIPAQIFQSPSFAKLFSKAQKCGVDLRDFRTNGIYLPGTEKLAVKSQRPLHRGPHPHYNQMVAERLCAIERSNKHYENEASYLGLRISNTQRALHKMLSNKPCKIILNKRDPLSRSVDFTHLEADVDRLWAGISETSG